MTVNVRIKLILGILIKVPTKGEKKTNNLLNYHLSNAGIRKEGIDKYGKRSDHYEEKGGVVSNKKKQTNKLSLIFKA